MPLKTLRPVSRNKQQTFKIFNIYLGYLRCYICFMYLNDVDPFLRFIISSYHPSFSFATAYPLATPALPSSMAAPLIFPFSSLSYSTV